MFRKEVKSMIDDEPEIMTKEMEPIYRKVSRKDELKNQKKNNDMKKIEKRERKEKQTINPKRRKNAEKDLSSYFEKGKKKNAGLWIKESKHNKEKDNKNSKVSEVDIEDVQNTHVYNFRDKKFFKVEVFVKYLEDNFLDIDKIAKEILDDETFYGWIRQNSDVFSESLQEFKEIKEIIEKN
ncbi:MAG: hypothetical protein KJ847_06120 [Firmicutes bacterium]|nr:hypothetical protein [Bacillota bacterium]